MKIPFDRVVTFILPYVNIVAGLLASWLITNVHVLGLFTNVNDLTTAVSSAVVFAIVTGAAELGRSQWLKGRHIELTGVAQENLAVTNAVLSNENPVDVNVTVKDPNDTSGESDDTPSGAEAHDDGVDLATIPNVERPESGVVPDNPEA